MYCLFYMNYNLHFKATTFCVICLLCNVMITSSLSIQSRRTRCRTSRWNISVRSGVSRIVVFPMHISGGKECLKTLKEVD